jgi:phosphoglycerate dehydrogenase-like enzyme
VPSLEALLSTSDHVVLAAPATPDTRHLIDGQALAHAKPGLHLVNVARGSLVDQDALLSALDQGRLGRASLDVTEPEPLPTGHPLYTHPKAFLSPHTSAISPLQQQELAARFAENLARYERGEALIDEIGPERLARAY